jgi:aminopeptidase N
VKRIAVVIAFVAGACGGEEHPEGPMEFVAKHYDLAVDLQSRAVRTQVNLAITSAGDCLDLPLRSLPDSALIDGEAGEASYDGSTLTVCGQGWDEGTELLLEVSSTIADETWADTQVGHSITTDVEGNDFTYLLSWVEGCDRLGPCDNRPDQFASYRFDVTHPDGVTVLCPGVLSPGPTNTVCTFEDFSAPTYSAMGIAASPSWQTSNLGTWGSANVTLYDMPSSGLGPEIKSDVHDQFMTWMAERFGTYPYGDELRLFVGPTNWNGFEHPGNIALNDSLHRDFFRYSDNLTHVINHELAHMWAGNQTTLASTRDFVWKEAIVEYLTFVFEDEVQGWRIAAKTPAYWKKAGFYAEYFAVPEEPNIELVEFFGHVYGPGPMILFRQLEALYGREPIMSALGQLLGQQRPLSITDVEVALADAVGANLDTYFDKWLHGSGAPQWPSFRVDYVQNGASVDVTVSQDVHPDGLFGAAFSVELRGADDAVFPIWFDMGVNGSPSKSATVEPGFDVLSAVFDADSHTLARKSDLVRGTEPRPALGWMAKRIQ